jgi:hypothetical protein
MLVFTIGADELYQEPIQFYFQRYCESGSRRSGEYRFEHFGTIIHETLKSLYDPFGDLFQNQIFKMLQANR